MTKSKLLFQQLSWCNSKINNLIWPVVFNSLKTSTLSACFRKMGSKLKELCWWQSQILAYSKTNNRIWQGFKLIRDFVHVHLICKFQEDLSKLKELCWWHAFSHCKPARPFGCYSKVFIVFPWKADVINPPPQACYRWGMVKVSLHCRDTTSQRCWRTTDVRLLS